MTSETEYSVDHARRAAARGELADWVRRFLASPGSDNRELGRQLSDELSCWAGPTRLRISELHRLAGPPGDPVLCAVDDDYWSEDVADMADKADEDGWEPPPVVVVCRGDQLVLEDGNHRVEALRRAGEDEVWAVVGFEDADVARTWSDRTSTPLT